MTSGPVDLLELAESKADAMAAIAELRGQIAEIHEQMKSRTSDIGNKWWKSARMAIVKKRSELLTLEAELQGLETIDKAMRRARAGVPNPEKKLAKLRAHADRMSRENANLHKAMKQALGQDGYMRIVTIANAMREGAE